MIERRQQLPYCLPPRNWSRRFLPRFVIPQADCGLILVSLQWHSEFARPTPVHLEPILYLRQTKLCLMDLLLYSHFSRSGLSPSLCRTASAEKAYRRKHASGRERVSYLHLRQSRSTNALFYATEDEVYQSQLRSVIETCGCKIVLKLECMYLVNTQSISVCSSRLPILQTAVYSILSPDYRRLSRFDDPVHSRFQSCLFGRSTVATKLALCHALRVPGAEETIR